MSKNILFFAAILWLAVACTPAETALPLATETIAPVDNPVLTVAPAMSATAQPTSTPSPTNSLTPPKPTETSTPTETQTPTQLPPNAYLEPLNHQWQTLNNCHRASIAILMGYYDVWFTQHDYDLAMDNLAEFVAPHGLTARIYAIRYSSQRASDIVRWLLAAGIPVIVGQDLSLDDNTWHYRVARGYDDVRQEIIVDDSLLGANLHYTYETFDQLSRGDGQIIPVYPLKKDEIIQLQMKAWQMKLIEYP